MTIGPVQLLVLGFSHPDFRGEIMAELNRLNDSETVRVIDSLTVYRDPNGDVAILKRSDLNEDEAAEMGAVIGALIGFGAGGEEGMEIGAEVGAQEMSEGVNLFTEEDAWDVLEGIPNDTAAAIVLLEHKWAIPLRDAIREAGGFPLGAEFISPLDLVAVGLVSAEEAGSAALEAEKDV